MERITRKEAFECALAQIISIAQVVIMGKKSSMITHWYYETNQCNQ